MTSPQDLVGMIVGKAVKMAEMMNIPVLPQMAAACDSGEIESVKGSWLDKVAAGIEYLSR